ncbi:hypothetical protein BDR22DRAFT_959384 [Usnea florida]
MQWGPDADAKLFVHVLKIHNVKLNYEALASAMGNGTTPPPATATTNPTTNANPAAPAKTTGNGKATAKDKKKKEKDATPTAAGGKAPKRTANGSVKNGKAVPAAEASAGGNAETGAKNVGGVGDDDEEEEVSVKPSGRKRVKVEMGSEEGMMEEGDGVGA